VTEATAPPSDPLADWTPLPPPPPSQPAPGDASNAGGPGPVPVAGGSSTRPRPRLTRWPVAVGPIAVGLSAILVYLFAFVVFSPAHSSSSGGSSWLAHNDAAIQALNVDQAHLEADASADPSGGSARADWHRFHQDAVDAAGLPNPGGRATVPWREMLNDFIVGSQAIIQGIDTRDGSLIKQAQMDLTAGGAAATQFDRAMGLNGQ
jgi:hypothetical protein